MSLFERVSLCKIQEWIGNQIEIMNTHPHSVEIPAITKPFGLMEVESFFRLNVENLKQQMESQQLDGEDLVKACENLFQNLSRIFPEAFNYICRSAGNLDVDFYKALLNVIQNERHGGDIKKQASRLNLILVLSRGKHGFR